MLKVTVIIITTTTIIIIIIMSAYLFYMDDFKLFSRDKTKLQ